MTRKNARNVIENVLNIKCNFIIYSCTDNLVIIKFFNKSDYDDSLKKIKKHDFLIRSRTYVPFYSDGHNKSKYFIDFFVPEKYIKKTQKTIYDYICGDSDCYFDLDRYFKNNI